MNPVLRAVDAEFARDGVRFVDPFSLRITAGEVYELFQPDARAASIAARMCAAIVKPTGGTVFVGEFETRLQPPQAKRLVGFVDAAGFLGDAHAFKCELAFRAEVWQVGHGAAKARAQQLIGRLEDGVYARAVALALVADVALVVLDQPPPDYVQRVQSIVPGAGILVAIARAPELPHPPRAFSTAGTL